MRYREKEFITARKGGIINGVSRSAQTIIESVQPYLDESFGRPAINNPLRIIHDLDVTDKHVLLVVVVGAAFLPDTIQFNRKVSDIKIIGFEPSHWADRLLRAEPGGTKVLTIRFSEMHPELEVNANVRYQIAFEQFGIREIEPVIPGLTHLRDSVIKTIELFNAEF